MSEEVGEKAGENSGNAVEVKIEDLVLVVGNMNRFLALLASSKAFSTAEVSLADWLILSTVSGRNTATPNQLIKLLGVAPQRVSQIVERLKEHQGTPSDILARHLAFEQAISDVPLVVGNKVTLLKNAGATYGAMLAAIRGAHDSIDMDMFIFSDGPVGQMFADALIERQRHGVQVSAGKPNAQHHDEADRGVG